VNRFDRTTEWSPGTRRALQAFTVIVLAHWAEHLVQAYQVYALKWPMHQSGAASLGQPLPVARALRGGSTSAMR